MHTGWKSRGGGYLKFLSKSLGGGQMFNYLFNNSFQLLIWLQLATDKFNGDKISHGTINHANISSGNINFDNMITLTVISENIKPYNIKPNDI